MQTPVAPDKFLCLVESVPAGCRYQAKSLGGRSQILYLDGSKPLLRDELDMDLALHPCCQGIAFTSATSARQNDGGKAVVLTEEMLLTF